MSCSRMPLCRRLKSVRSPREPPGSDRAHDANLQVGIVQTEKLRSFLPHTHQFFDDLLEPGTKQGTEIGDMREIALAPK